MKEPCVIIASASLMILAGCAWQTRECTDQTYYLRDGATLEPIGNAMVEICYVESLNDAGPATSLENCELQQVLTLPNGELTVEACGTTTLNYMVFWGTGTFVPDYGEVIIVVRRTADSQLEILVLHNETTHDPFIAPPAVARACQSETLDVGTRLTNGEIEPKVRNCSLE